MKIVSLNNKLRKQAIQALREAASREGCFLVSESPFSENYRVREQVQKQLSQFYSLPEREKLSVGQLSGTGLTRGYFPIGSESGSIELIEKKESFSYGYDEKLVNEEFKKESQLVGPNLWHPSFERAQFLRLLESFNETSRQLIDLCTEAFEKDFGKIFDQTSLYQNFIRSFKYHGVDLSKGESQKYTGNSLHSDWNLITLVSTDAPGFQYQNDDHTFTDADNKSDPNLLICNFGDFMSSLTEGKVRSPWHQVIPPPPNKFRNSLVHFCYPSHYYPPISTPVFNQGKPLGLFVDQTQKQGTLWDIQKHNFTNMGQIYAAKWKQVSRQY